MLWHFTRLGSRQGTSRSILISAQSSVVVSVQTPRQHRVCFRLRPANTAQSLLLCVCLAGGVASSDVVACGRWPANTVKTPIRLIADPLAFQRKTHNSKSRPMARAVAETQRHLNRQGSLDFCRSCTLRDVHGESSGLWCFCFEGTHAGSSGFRCGTGRSRSCG